MKHLSNLLKVVRHSEQWSARTVDKFPGRDDYRIRNGLELVEGRRIESAFVLTHALRIRGAQRQSSSGKTKRLFRVRNRHPAAGLTRLSNDT